MVGSKWKTCLNVNRKNKKYFEKKKLIARMLKQGAIIMRIILIKKYLS